MHIGVVPMHYGQCALSLCTITFCNLVLIVIPLIIADAIYWPAFVIATAAAIVASQATISATYSIIKQALALGCFPRVKIVHTSKKFLGQIYIPDINWVLLVLCIAVTAGFKNQSQIGNAYGKFSSGNQNHFLTVGAEFS